MRFFFWNTNNKHTSWSKGAILVPDFHAFVPSKPPCCQYPSCTGTDPCSVPSRRNRIPFSFQTKPYVWKSVLNPLSSCFSNDTDFSLFELANFPKCNVDSTSLTYARLPRDSSKSISPVQSPYVFCVGKNQMAELRKQRNAFFLKKNIP